MLTAVVVVVVTGKMPRHEHTDLNCFVNIGCWSVYWRSAQAGHSSGMLVGISVAAIVKLPSMPECIGLVMVLTRGKWFSLLLKIVKVVVDIALFQIMRF